MNNLVEVLKKCKDCTTVLHREQCQFMINEYIVGHRISWKRIDVYHSKVEVMEKIHPPISFKGVRNDLGHAALYWTFINNIFKITHPLCKLLEKYVISILKNLV